MKLNMKKILFLTGVLSLLGTSGCLVSEGGRHGHGRHGGHSEVMVVGPPPVVVHAPVVVVRPPEIIVR
ncbi:MAG: hypothetical protein MUF81_06775 [Verrucomicrobia bacterium]|nr:hypothetical protein [Verrucomicrobiota bacterium]